MMRILNRIVSVTLSLALFLSLCPKSFSLENQDDNQLCYISVKMLEETEGGFISPDAADEVKALVANDCVYIDFDWISSALHLRVNEAYNPEIYRDTQNTYLKIFNSSYAKSFNVDLSDSSEKGKGFCIQKPGKSSFTFYFRENSDVAFGYSLSNGSIVTELGGKVKCIDGTRYIPLTMLLKLTDSGFYVSDGVVSIIPCKKTVMDIMNTTGLSRYNYDIIEDGGMSHFDYALSKGYCDFYSRIKSLFQGSVTFNVQTVLDSIPGSYSKAVEELAVQYCTPCPEEYNAISDAAAYEASAYDLTGELAKTVTDIALKNPDDEVEFWAKISKMWAEKWKNAPYFESYEEAEAWNNYLNSNDEIIDALKRSKWDHRIEDSVDAFGIAMSTFFDYISMGSMIASSDQKYVDAVNEYLFQYDKVRQWGESLGLYYTAPEKYHPITLDDSSAKDVFTDLQTLHMNTVFKSQFADDVKLLDGHQTNLFTNKELATNVIKSAVNAGVSTGASRILDKSFGKVLLDLKVAAIGWDIAETFANKASGGTFDGLDAIYFSQYNMQIEHDSEVILAYSGFGHSDKTLMSITLNSGSNNADILLPYHSTDNVDQYRKLEWMCLKSYYLTRQNMLAFYQPQKKKHPEEYKNLENEIMKECDTILSMMSTLLLGPVGVTNESLSNSADIRQAMDEKLTDAIKFRLSGTVLDEVSKKPIRNAIIEVENPNTGYNDAFLGTQKDGIFELYIPHGKYNVIASAKYHLPLEEAIDIKTNTDLGAISLQHRIATSVIVKNETERKNGSTIMYGVLTGIDNESEEAWSYRTKDYPAAGNAEVLQEIGIRGDRYYFVDYGAVKAFNLSDGASIWEWDGIGEYAPGAADFGDDDTLYISGYLSPAFVALDKDGKLLKKIKSFGDDIYGAYKVEYQGDKVAIYFECEYPSIVRYVSLKDYSVIEDTYEFLRGKWENVGGHPLADAIYTFSGKTILRNPVDGSAIDAKEIEIRDIIKTSYGYFLKMGEKGWEYGYRWKKEDPDYLLYVETWDPDSLDGYSGSSSLVKHEVFRFVNCGDDDCCE